jgi:hypothetical protein
MKHIKIVDLFAGPGVTDKIVQCRFHGRLNGNAAVFRSDEIVKVAIITRLGTGKICKDGKISYWTKNVFCIAIYVSAHAPAAFA